MSLVNGITAYDAFVISNMIIEEGLAKDNVEVSDAWWQKSKTYVSDISRCHFNTVSHFAVEDLKRELDAFVADVPVAKYSIWRIREQIAKAEEIGRFLCHQ